MSIRTGQLSKVINKAKRHSQNDEYICVWVKDGSEALPLLFTKSELDIGLYRAIKNPEDIVNRSFISKLID